MARPSKFGNPYRLNDYRIDYPEADQVELRRMATSDFRGLVEGKWGEEHDYPPLDQIRRELAGLSLACYCPLPAPGEPDYCHAAVLLEVANA